MNKPENKPAISVGVLLTGLRSVPMSRDIWRAMCKVSNLKRGRFIHVSTAIGQDANGDIKRAGFTYRLSPIERAIKSLSHKGRYRRAQRRQAKLDLESSGVGSPEGQEAGLG